MMTAATAEEDRSPPRPENQGFRRNYFNFFGNPSTPNPSNFEILRNFVSLGIKIPKVFKISADKFSSKSVVKMQSLIQILQDLQQKLAKSLTKILNWEHRKRMQIL